jgi:hypothetical protein
MPFWQDVSPTRQILSDAAALTVNKITASKDIARIQMDGNAWSVNDLAKILSGDDPMGALVELVGDYWIRVDQALIISSLKGIFAAATMAGNKLTIASESTGGVTSATQLNGSTFVDATVKLGDRGDRLTAIAMHSATEAALRKLDLIDFIPDSEGKAQIRTFQGRRVIVDDNLPTRAGTTSGTVYTSYLFGPGAFARGVAPLAGEPLQRHAIHQSASVHPASAGREVHFRLGGGHQPDQYGTGNRLELDAGVREQERPDRGGDA